MLFESDKLAGGLKRLSLKRLLTALAYPRTQRWQRQHGSRAAEASSAETASAARWQQRQRGGSISGAAEAAWQRRNDGGQRGRAVGSKRVAAAVQRRR